MRRAQFALAALGLAVLSAGLMRARLRHEAPPPIETAHPADLGPAPDFSLTDQDGRSFHRAELDGSVWVAAFIFTSCRGQCPMMTARMKALSGRLPAVRFVSFSVDPGDSPADLKAFAARYGAGWTFLTGTGDTVQRLARRGFKLASESGGGPEEPILHSSRLVLVGRSGRILGYFDPNEPADADRLAAAAAGL